MDKIWKAMAYEPTRLIGHSVTLLLLILDVLTIFGVIFESQQTALATLLTTLAGILGVSVESIRSQVYSPGSVQLMKDIWQVHKTTKDD